MGSSTRFSSKEKEEICLECKIKCSPYYGERGFPFSLQKSHKVFKKYKTDYKSLFQYCKHYSISSYRTFDTNFY